MKPEVKDIILYGTKGENLELHYDQPTSVILRKQQIPLLLQHIGNNDPSRQIGRGLHTVGQSLPDVRPHHQPVHHDLNIVLFVLVIDQIIDQILELDEGSRIQILAPVVRARKGEYAKVFEDARKSGYVVQVGQAP